MKNKETGRQLYTSVHNWSLPHTPLSYLSPDPTEKVNYAKRMAKGYLRSVGIGEYTPKRDSYLRDPDSPKEEGKVTKWKRTDSDEFDF